MSLFGFGQNRKLTRENRNRAKRNLQQSRSNLRSRDDTVDRLISDIVNIADGARSQGDQSVEDRFGRQLRSTQDHIQANTAGAQNAISRGLMAQGGDFTGTATAGLSQVQQQGNQAQSDAINQYSTMTKQMNQRDKRRGDNMISRALQGSESMARRGQQQYGMDRQLLNQADMQEIQRRQANRQFGLDIASTAIDTISPDFFGSDSSD